MTAESEDPKLGELKSRAQLLKPVVRISHDGVSLQVIAALNEALEKHELVKVKFVALKDQKKILAPALAEQTNSRLVLRVGNTATYWRARAAE